MPECTFCCKLRCLISLALLVAGLFLLSTAPLNAGPAPDETATAAEPVSGKAGDKAIDTLKAGNAGAVNSGYLMQLVAGLLVVLLSIVVLAWFAKRFNRLQGSADGSLQIISGISLGSRERVVLLRAGETRLVLGVSPGRVSTLHVMSGEQQTEPEQAAGTAAPSHSFASSLQAMVAKHTGGRRYLRAGAE